MSERELLAIMAAILSQESDNSLVRLWLLTATLLGCVEAALDSKRRAAKEAPISLHEIIREMDQ